MPDTTTWPRSDDEATTRRPVKLLAALLGERRVGRGVVALQTGGCDAADAARRIAASLDWRVETFEAAHVNLNDLDAPNSPLSQMLRHVVASGKRYVFVIQGVTPTLVANEESRRRLERIASMTDVVLAMVEPPAHTHGWGMADLRR